LARAHDRIREGESGTALEACVNALESLKGKHPDLTAQVYLCMSTAHKLAKAHIEANLAFERAQEELQKAADLIEDEDFRTDFLARPVFRELRKKRETFADAEERLSALYDMVHSLNSGGDPEDKLGVILDQALRVVRAERGLILLRSEGDDRYQVRFSRNLEEQTIEEAAQFSRTAVLAAGKGESVLAVNAGNDERLKQMKSVSAYGITSLLCVPLRSRDDLVGAVYVDSRSDGALFRKQDLTFLEAFADHAALALENARRLRRLEQRRSQLLSATESRESFGALIGRSPGMQKVYDMIERVAGSHLPVLIQGESGTGKELVAREIFRGGLRKDGPFLSENCAAIAPDLIESELFGHVKGAFTGAERDKAGLFEQADGGTLFLDEIGDMAPAMQARLLRVLQEGEIRRVGDEVRKFVDVRLITATHRDLNRRVEEGAFREDLLYRLQVLVIQLPPLRDRPLDIAPLVQHFLGKIAAQRGQKQVEVRTEAMELFERYAWPGNVRQLENTLQRLALLADGGVINRATIEQDPALQAALIGQSGRPTLSLKKNERDRIAEALERSGGNRLEAAKLLGVSRATIFRKIKHYDLN
jgi:Nif-specific regulatory protein